MIAHQAAIRLAFVCAFVLASVAGLAGTGPQHAYAQIDEAASLAQQAATLYKDGNYSEAIPVVQRLLSIREAAFGAHHLDVAASLNNLGVLYRARGRYADAEPYYQRALAIQETILGPDHPDVAASLNNLGVLYKDQGRYAEAEPLHKRSLAIKEKTFGPDHPDVTVSLSNLGLLYRGQGRYADAEPLFKRSLAIDEYVRGADHPDVARSLNNLGLLYRDQSRYTDAEALFKRSLAIKEKMLGPEHPDLSTSLKNLGLLYHTQSRYADAEPLYKRALAIDENVRGAEHPDVAMSLNSLGGLYLLQGRYAEAEPLIRRALTLNETFLGRDHPEFAKSLNVLAALHHDQGRYAEADPLYKRALAIFEKALGAEHPDVANSLNSLATLYQDQGQYADAEALLRRSLAIIERTFGPDHPDVANSLNNLGAAYRRKHRNDEAESLYKRSLAIKESSLGPDHPNVASTLNNLGQLYHDQGRYAEAEPLYQRSVAIREKTFGADHPGVGPPLTNLGLLYRAEGRYTDAELLLKRSLTIRESALGSQHPDVARALNNLALLYQDRGRYADAEPLQQRSMAILATALGADHPDVASSLINLALLHQRRGRYAVALPLIRTAALRGFIEKSFYLDVVRAAASRSLIVNSDAVGESFRVVQQAASSAASDAINQLSTRFAAGNDHLAQLIRTEQDLSSEKESLDKLILAAASKEPTYRDAARENTIKERLKSIVDIRAKIERELRNEFPDFVALSKPVPLSVEETQALLADDEALAIFDFDKRSYVWIITHSSADWRELKMTGNDLDAQVKLLRSSLTQKADIPFDVSASYRLYDSVFGPFADKIASKKRLSVVTNGALTSIPLQLLITKDPTGKKLKDIDWLVRSHSITVLPSVASLKALRVRAFITAAPKPMGAFADPVFSKIAKREARQQVASRGITSFAAGTQIDIASLAEHLPQLPSTRDEVQAIAKVLSADPIEIRLGLDATVTAVKNAKLDEYRIVYFATHGLVAGDLEKFATGKVEPALALSIPDTPSDFDNGLLSASEVAQLKLNAEWVVLSACNTAAEDKPGAEALSGLARAFFYAGARSLLVSHWEVDDEATANLMTRIFLGMRDNPKLSHGEALRQAIVGIIDGASSDADLHPRLWAPFVVVGEPAKEP